MEIIQPSGIVHMGSVKTLDQRKKEKYVKEKVVGNVQDSQKVVM